MIRDLVKILFLALLAVAGGVGIYVYSFRNSSQQQIVDLQRQKQELEQIVQRLGSERRIAQVLVTDQHRDSQNVLKTTLLLVEESRAGVALPPKRITVAGDHIYIDALVIKFDEEYSKAGDPLRGQSIALFDKVFGSAEMPDQATRIDPPGRIPDIYRGSDAAVSEFEQSLWKSFWNLASNPELARSQGVRVAQGQSIYGPLATDKLYTLTIRPDGNIDMTAQPVPAVFREAMKESSSSGPF